LVENHFPTENDLLDRIAVCLSGMAAEAVVFESRSIGSGGTFGSDVERATSIARRMVGSYGLGKTPIFISSVEGIQGTPLPDALESEAVSILETQYARVFSTLKNERERLIALAADVVSNRLVTIERASGIDG
jgi:ATP-dependent Zn protease